MTFCFYLLPLKNEYISDHSRWDCQTKGECFDTAFEADVGPKMPLFLVHVVVLVPMIALQKEIPKSDR